MKAYILFSICLLIGLFSCKDYNFDPTGIARDIDELISAKGVNDFRVAESRDSISFSVDTLYLNSGDKWIVKNIKTRLSKNLSSCIPSLNYNLPALWVGAIVKGDGIQNGELTPIDTGIPRFPVALKFRSMSSIDSSILLVNPDRSNYRQTVKTMLSSKKSEAIKVTLASSIAYRKEQGLIDIDFNPDIIKASALSDYFSAQIDSGVKTIFFRVRMEYFSVNMLPPAKPSQFFNSGVTLDMLQKEVVLSKPLAYVSSMAYGKDIILNMKYKGNRLPEDVLAELNDAFEYLKTGVGSFKAKSIFDSCFFNGIILDSKLGIRQCNEARIANVLKIINEENVFSDCLPNKPISYELKNVADNSVIKLATNTEFVQKDFGMSFIERQRFSLFLWKIYLPKKVFPEVSSKIKFFVCPGKNNQGFGTFIDGDDYYAYDGLTIYINKSTQIFELPKNQGEFFDIIVDIAEYYNDEYVSRSKYSPILSYLRSYDFNTYFYPWNDFRENFVDTSGNKWICYKGLSNPVEIYIKIIKEN